MNVDAPATTSTAQSTAGLLARAQQVADQLQQEAKLEAERLTADLRTLHEEARELRGAAERDHVEALRARKQADDILSGASQEAAEIIRDANEQASLLMASAQGARDQQVEAARQEAEQVRARTTAEAHALRAEAQQVRDLAGEEAAELVSTARAEAEETAAAATRRATEMVDQARATAQQHLDSAAGESESLRESASVEAARMRREATEHAEQLRAESTGEAERTSQLADAALAAARAESEEKMRLAAEQTEWATATVRSVLDGAALEAAAIRRSGHVDAQVHVRDVRRRLQEAIGRVRDRAADELAAAVDRGEDITQIAALAAGQMESEAQAVRQRAEADAARVLADATYESERAVERLERRRTEAETGAASLRSLVAEEVTRLRAEAAEHLRLAREEANRHVAEGRSEADRLRESASRALERARAEVAQLQIQRDQIAVELGQLSGVIEALSVPEREAATSPDPSPPEDAGLPRPALPTRPPHDAPEQENPHG